MLFTQRVVKDIWIFRVDQKFLTSPKQKRKKNQIFLISLWQFGLISWNCCYSSVHYEFNLVQNKSIVQSVCEFNDNKKELQFFTSTTQFDIFLYVHSTRWVCFKFKSALFYWLKTQYRYTTCLTVFSFKWIIQQIYIILFFKIEPGVGWDLMLLILFS